MFLQPHRPTALPASQRVVTRWALTATLLGALSLAPLSAWSLALGGMRVQSALGEPLRAQLSLGELTPEELSSVNAGFAPAALYQAAGIVLNPTLSNVQISIDRSVPSNVVVNLTSTTPVSEPFLDMLIEIKWASGKVVRDYTLLFNPPAPEATPVSTDPVVITAPVATDPSVPLPVPAEVAATTAVGAVVDAVAEKAVTETPAAEPTATPAPPPAAAQRLRVVRGDTAGALAKANLPDGVSLEQMLQAMLRANPSAFVGNNVNRLKAGAQLTLPTAQEAQSMDPAQARRLVLAQSKDFKAYRRSLAANAPRSAVGPAGQAAAGRIETQVQDKAEAPATPDQLTLSKGAVATGAEAEAQIAAAKKAQDEQAQQADLTRNIDDLKALAEAAPGTPTPSASTTESPTGPTVSPAPAAPTPPAEPPAPSDKPRQPIEDLMAQPWTVPAALGLLAVLMGLVISRLNRRQRIPAPATPEPQAPTLAANDDTVEPVLSTGSLNFNLDDINLDLTPPAPASEPDDANAEALFTKFELAKEFLSLGDRVAAKALAEEVHADATGLLKRRAELFLSELG